MAVTPSPAKRSGEVTRQPDRCPKTVLQFGKRYILLKDFESKNVAGRVMRKDSNEKGRAYEYIIKKYYAGFRAEGRGYSDENGYRYGIYYRAVSIGERM